MVHQLFQHDLTLEWVTTRGKLHWIQTESDRYENPAQKINYVPRLSIMSRINSKMFSKDISKNHVQQEILNIKSNMIIKKIIQKNT